jgi:DNA-binding PadR family transcriptional regulator
VSAVPPAGARTHLTKREALVLETLAASHTGMVGLELVAASEGRLRWGRIYPTLHRLEDEGLVHSREEERPGHPEHPRRRYDITVTGCRALDTLPVRDVFLARALLTCVLGSLLAWWIAMVWVTCRAAGWC